MTFQLAPLPYSHDALEPHISRETLQIHHGKHHAGYVSKLAAQVADGPQAGKTLEELVVSTSGGLFNLAAQSWNHDFYWKSMSPAGEDPGTEVTAALERSFGSVDAFRQEFLSAAGGQFGSGWAWLVEDGPGELAVVTTSNAGNPLTEGRRPILVCDVWEHAYYVDYRNDRARYLDAWWTIVNWEFVAANLAARSATAA